MIFGQVLQKCNYYRHVLEAQKKRHIVSEIHKYESAKQVRNHVLIKYLKHPQK